MVDYQLWVYRQFIPIIKEVPTKVRQTNEFNSVSFHDLCGEIISEYFRAVISSIQYLILQHFRLLDHFHADTYCPIFVLYSQKYLLID